MWGMVVDCGVRGGWWLGLGVCVGYSEWEVDS